MAKLVIISKEHASLSHELGRQWVTIGRGPANAFQILESSVSGQHCEVLWRDNQLLVRDMRSTNGTYINGRMVAEGALRIGETMQLGEVEVRLEASDSKLTPLSVYPTDEKSNTNNRPSTSSGIFGARKLQVLLVDDSMAFLETAGDTFETLANGEWEVHRACGADQALNLVQERQIEVAVLDINMPMLDGVQLLGMLHRRYPEVKKVILTATSSEANRTHCLANGAELFLEKPIARDGMRFVFNLLNDLISWKQREGFAGTLRAVGLTDIIQIECLRRSSCLLEISAPHAKGEIYIESGVIIHAVSGSVSGQRALHRLLSLDNGQFHVYPYRHPLERSIYDSWECLLMESARVRDEERSARVAEKTAFVTRTAIETRKAADSPPQKPDSNEKVELPEMGNDIVVISTYDGKWKSADNK
jgi:CheY-like chemotaxis protein